MKINELTKKMQDGTATIADVMTRAEVEQALDDVLAQAQLIDANQLSCSCGCATNRHNALVGGTHSTPDHKHICDCRLSMAQAGSGGFFQAPSVMWPADLKRAEVYNIIHSVAVSREADDWVPPATCHMLAREFFGAPAPRAATAPVKAALLKPQVEKKAKAAKPTAEKKVKAVPALPLSQAEKKRAAKKAGKSK